MAVIGNFLGAAGNNSVNPSPALEMHESEASFQAVVDPYARADFFISFGEEGVDLEEGFATLTELPGELLTRVGKMRAAFGKVNTLHNHVLPWTDRPLVTNNLVGGEEGISDAGISVARLIPTGTVFLEATGQVFRGDSADVFTSSERGDLSYVAHLRGYHDLTRIDQSRFRRVCTPMDTTPPASWRRRRRALHDAAVRRRRDVPVAPADPRDLSPVRGAERDGPEPSRTVRRAAEQHGLLRLRRLSVRAPLVGGRPVRSVRSRR